MLEQTHSFWQSDFFAFSIWFCVESDLYIMNFVGRILALSALFVLVSAHIGVYFRKGFISFVIRIQKRANEMQIFQRIFEIIINK